MLPNLAQPLVELNYRQGLLATLERHRAGEPAVAEGLLSGLSALFSKTVPARPDETLTCGILVETGPLARALHASTLTLQGVPPLRKPFIEARQELRGANAEVVVLAMRATLGLINRSSAHWAAAQLDVLQEAASCGAGGVVFERRGRSGQALYDVYPRPGREEPLSAVDQVNATVPLGQLAARVAELSRAHTLSAWIMQHRPEVDPGLVLDFVRDLSERMHQVQSLKAFLASRAADPDPLAVLSRDVADSAARWVALPDWLSDRGPVAGVRVVLGVQQGLCMQDAAGATGPEVPVTTWGPSPEEIALQWSQLLAVG